MDLRRHGERAGARGPLGTARSRRPAAPSNRRRSRDRDRSPGNSAAGRAAPSAPCSRPSACRGRESRNPTAARPASAPCAAAPGALLLRQAAIEDAQRQRAAFRRRAQRADAVLHEVEIAGVAAGDRDGSFRHVVRMAHRPFAVACHSATVAPAEDTMAKHVDYYVSLELALDLSRVEALRGDRQETQRRRHDLAGRFRLGLRGLGRPAAAQARAAAPSLSHDGAEALARPSRRQARRSSPSSFPPTKCRRPSA